MKPFNDDSTLWNVTADRAGEALTGDAGPSCCWYYGCCWFWSEARAETEESVAA